MPRVVRGCGVRVTGGLYVYCTGESHICIALPFKLPESCPCCGNGIERFRGIRVINPKKLVPISITAGLSILDRCGDRCISQSACSPTSDRGALMWVGREYYPNPDDFILEGMALGFSKRVPFKPEALQIGDPIYFVHPDGMDKGVAGVIAVAHITEWHKIVSKDTAQDEDYVKSWEDRGVTCVLEEGEI